MCVQECVCACTQVLGCSSISPQPSPSPSLLFSYQGGARPQDVCRLYSAWALTQAPLIHGRMDELLALLAEGRAVPNCPVREHTSLEKFRGGAGAWLRAQASLYPFSAYGGAPATCQLGVPAITNKGSPRRKCTGPSGKQGRRDKESSGSGPLEKHKERQK